MSQEAMELFMGDVSELATELLKKNLKNSVCDSNRDCTIFKIHGHYINVYYNNYEFTSIQVKNIIYDGGILRIMFTSYNFAFIKNMQCIYESNQGALFPIQFANMLEDISRDEKYTNYRQKISRYFNNMDDIVCIFMLMSTTASIVIIFKKLILFFYIT